MKRTSIGSICLSLTLSLFAMAGLASASSYPPSYFFQTVRIAQQGPALFVHVGSGCGSHEVIGYKPTGILANGNPESIDAVVKGICQGNNETQIKQSVLKLGREWHGQGYMSEPHGFYNYLPAGCSDSSHARIEVAFSAQGQWDSLNGANYGYNGEGFYSNSQVALYETNEDGCDKINQPAWNFIIEQMSK